MAGESAVTYPKHRQCIHIVRTLGLLAKTAAIVRRKEQRGQVRPALEHLVHHRDRAADGAYASLRRLPNTKQTHYIRAVGVEAQRSIGEGAGIGRQEGLSVDHAHALDLSVALANISALVADKAHQLSPAVLEYRCAEIAAEAIIELAELVLAVAPDGNAPQF